MRITLAGLRHFLLGLMLFLPVITGAAYAQTKGAPASQAQSPESRAAESRAAESQAQRQQVQPGNNAPTWREARSGKEEYTSVKGRETGVLIQNDGQTWRKLRNGPIMFYGGWAVVLMLIVPILLMSRRRWALYVNQVVLVLGAGMWCLVAYAVMDLRREVGQPYLRMLAILGAVALIALVSAALLAAPKVRAQFR